MSSPVELFYSYAHEDLEFVVVLEEHLSALRRGGLLSTWYDKQIGAGDEWRALVLERLERADIILLLVSASFLNSEFINNVELVTALERRKRGARVIPVILRDCDWSDPPLRDLQAIPRDAIPLNRWDPPDDGYADVARRMRVVAQEVAAVKATQVVARPTAAPRAVFQHVPRRNLGFTGRERVLERLRATLIERDTRPLPVALVGMGGVGKTALATEYTYRFADQYGLVWWVRAEDASATAADLASLAVHVGVLDASPPSLGRTRVESGSTAAPAAGSGGVSTLMSDRSAAVAAGLRWLASNSGWLLVFDNANDSNTLIDYLPHAGDGHVLITSRSPLWNAVARPLDVDALPLHEGVRFLRSRLALDAGAASDVERLATLLGGLPLALEQAAGFMESTGMPIAEYLEIVASGVESSPLLSGVAATLEPSLGAIRRDSPAADELLRFCAWMAPVDIPKEAIVRGHAHLPPALAARAGSRVELARLIGDLRRFSLLMVRGDGLSLHRLVQRLVQEAMSEEERRAWLARVLEALDVVIPKDVAPKWWPTHERYLAHVLVVADHAQRLEVGLERTATLLARLGDYQSERARPLEARQVLEKALALAQSAVGPNGELVADVQLSLGNIAESLGDIRTAQQRYETALAIYRARSLLADVATCLNNIGYLAEQRRLYDRARQHYLEALEIERELGNEVEVANILLNVGSTSATLGQVDEARRFYEDALRIYEAQANPNTADVSIALAALGDLFLDTGDVAGARAAFERALTLDAALYGDMHPAVAVDLTELARAQLTDGDVAAAERSASRALDIQAAAYQNLHHPEVARAHFVLGRIREAQQQPEAALACFQAALEHDESNSIEVATDLMEIARLLATLGRSEEAISRYQHARRLYLEVPGLEHEADEVSAAIATLRAGS